MIRMEHPAYSPDLAPCDYYLFGHLKDHFADAVFEDEADAVRQISAWLRSISQRDRIPSFRGWMGNYSNSGFDRSSFLKTDNSNEFSSSCTTRIVPILTTGVSFLRSYKVSNKRPIMGHPRSDLGCPRSVLVGPGQSQVGPGLSQDGPGQSQAGPSMARIV